MSTLTPTADLLAAFEACTDHNSYWRSFVAVEARINYLEQNGQAHEGYEVQKQFTRINRAVRHRIEALAVRPSSTLDAVTAKVCADVFASLDRPILIAAE
jgi:hypothetical protein